MNRSTAERWSLAWRCTMAFGVAMLALLLGCSRDGPAAGATGSATAPAGDGTAARTDLAAPAIDQRFDPRVNRCLHRERVTFIVTADPHFGASPAIDQRNAQAIAQMNAISGMRWPEALGGTIEEPCGVLVLGDLTESGQAEQWQSFERAFGLRGGDGLVAFPAFETVGNHDGAGGLLIRDRVRARHGSTVYGWDWGPLHLVLLGAGPDDEDIAWLRRDLAAVPAERAIVIGLHYPLLGAFSEGHWFGDGAYRQKLADVLRGRRVVALFHGHYHAAGLYDWHGLPVFRPGSPKHSWHTFDVVEFDGTALRVGCWDYEQLRWRYGYRSASAPEGGARWADDGIVP